MLPFFLKGHPYMKWLIGAFLIFTIAFIAGSKRRFVPSLWIQRFKFLLPSWRFFERVGTRHALFVQAPITHEWIHLSLKVERSPWMALHNPQGNLRLAMDSLIEQLMQDLADLQNNTHWDKLTLSEHQTQIHGLTSYQLVEQLAIYLCQQLGIVTDPHTSFKISSFTQGQDLMTCSLDDNFIFYLQKRSQ